jgi:slime mold repeat-containing protein
VLASVPIDDGDPCTQDTCDPQTGVMHASLGSGASCVDGQGRGGTCDPGGVCFPTSDPAHEDGNPCTYDHAGGHNLLAGYSCEDGDVCNGAEVCSASGECVGGVAPVVDDGNPGTLDMCDALVGVVHKAIPVLDRKVPTRIAASNAFLYEQPNSLQIGVNTGNRSLRAR